MPDQKPTRKRRAVSSSPLDVSIFKYEVVDRPQTAKKEPPKLSDLHKEVINTYGVDSGGKPKAVQVAVSSVVKGKELVAQIRADLRRNGYTANSVMGEYHMTYVKIWMAEKRKRASAKKPATTVVSEGANATGGAGSSPA